jgi:hypothetical protein
MPAPKGMRFVPFAIGNTDAVHVYSGDNQQILLQLRRNISTETSIAKASFKVALSLTPDQAIAIAGELLTAATRKTVHPTQIATQSTNKPKPKPIQAKSVQLKWEGADTKG